MRISDEAVKAAVKAYINTGRPVGLAEIEAILEASAPHMQAEARDAARRSREQGRKLEAVTSIAVRLGASMQSEDRELSEELYAAIGLT